MGRIADALKKAEAEREATAGVTATLEGPDLRAEQHSPETVPDGPSPMIAEGPAASPRTPPAGSGRTATVGRASHALVALHGQDSILLEQYRSLRTRLSSRNPRARPRVLAITSSVAGEGKSVTTANLAIVLAEVRHHRVLALDADFRRSSLASLFGVEAHPGLADVLQGTEPIESAVQQTPVENLALIGAGGTGGIKPAELLSSKRAAAVFDSLRDQYDYVLVDTPPCFEVADAGIVGQLADGVLMVIRMGKTPQPTVKQVVQTLRGSQINLIGCVLTAAEDLVTPYGYDDGGAGTPHTDG